MANPRNLRPDEIIKLPVKEITDKAGSKIVVYYDESSNTVYAPKGDGTFQAAVLPKAPSKQTTDTQTKQDAKAKNPEKKSPKKPPKKAQDDDEDEKVRKPLTKKQIGMLVGVAVVIALFLYAFLSSGILSSGETTKPSGTGSETPSETSDVDLAAAECYEVLVVNHNMFRGDKLKADDLTTCIISKAEYAACGGAYTKECTSAVIGMEITKFMPFGTILTYDACYFPTKYATSPWGFLKSGQEYLDIPISIDIKDINEILPGDYVKLVLKVETTQKERNDSDNSDVDGMKHSSAISASTTTDTFEFASVQIVDRLDANGNSIYEKYSGLYSVPVGFIGTVLRQDYNEKTISRLIPCYFRIVVTKDQKKEIGDLSKGIVTVTLKRLSDADESTFPVSNYYELTEYISNAIIARYNMIQKELKEAQKDG